MIIGISGKLGSGKDTLANMIMMKYKLKLGQSIIKKSYAAKLKHISAYLTGLEEKLTQTQEGKNLYLKEWGMTLGEFLQKMGTEGMRQGVHPNGWVLALFSDYDYTKKIVWIITDVRFKNEAQAVKDRHGLLIRIEGDPANIRANSKRDINHSSETDLDNWKDWDVIINNKGSLEMLRQQAEAFLYLLQTEELDKIKNHYKDSIKVINNEISRSTT